MPGISGVILVDQRQQPQRASIVREAADEVVAPHVVLMFRSKPHARAVVQPQPASWLLLRGTFSPSRRQIRCTRSRPTFQPARCNNAVIRR